MAADFRRITVARRGDRTLNFYCNSCQLAAFGSKLQTAVDKDLGSCRARTWILRTEAGRRTACKCTYVTMMAALAHWLDNKSISPPASGFRWVKAGCEICWNCCCLQRSSNPAGHQWTWINIGLYWPAPLLQGGSIQQVLKLQLYMKARHYFPFFSCHFMSPVLLFWPNMTLVCVLIHLLLFFYGSWHQTRRTAIEEY